MEIMEDACEANVDLEFVIRKKHANGKRRTLLPQCDQKFTRYYR